MNHLQFVQEIVKVLRQLMVFKVLFLLYLYYVVLMYINFIFNFFVVIADLKNAFNKLEARVSVLEGKSPASVSYSKV